MGIRICFYRGSRNGALGHFLAAPLFDFRAWCIHESKMDDGGFVQLSPQGFVLLDAIIEHGAEALTPQTMEQAITIDLLLNDFYSWCDLNHKDMLGEMVGGMLKAYRYYEAASDIRSKCSEEATSLWDYLRTGRAIGRADLPFPYTPYEEGYPNAFWTYEEAEILHSCLSQLLQGDFSKEHKFVIESACEAVRIATEEGIGLVIIVS